MRLGTKVLGFVAASAMVCGTALAGGPECAKTCDAKAKAACKTDAKSCIGEVSGCMPKMIMMVGDKTFECPMSAGEAAKKEGKPVTYKVAGKTYEDKDKALAVYADAVDGFAAKFATVRTVEECHASCEGAGSCGGEKETCSKDKKTGTTAAKGGACCAGGSKDAKVAAKGAKAGTTMYCVVGQTFDSKEKAEEASKIGLAAMKEVKVAYRVGTKNFDCDKEAGEAAKADHAKITYVVGDNTMECPIQARIETAKAKVAAAMAAVTKANKTQDKA